MRLHKELIKSSAILFIGFGLFNFLHFLYQLFMARFLSVQDYGVLASVLVIVYISSVFSESIQNFVSKCSSEEQNLGKIKNFINRISKKIRRISLPLTIIYLIIMLGLSKLLDINYGLLAFAGTIMLLSLFIPITRGVMQGKKKFKSLSINMVLEASVKLFIGSILVLLGARVFGAIVGVVLASLVGFLFSRFQLKEIYSAKEEFMQTKENRSYILPTFILTAVVVIFYSLDVWMARIFFSPEASGAYAIASLLGKILFWGTIPISKAMMPISSDSENNNKKYVINNSLFLIILTLVVAIGLFYLFPIKIIEIFTGKDIKIAEDILFYEGISFGVIAVANLLLK